MPTALHCPSFAALLTVLFGATMRESCGLRLLSLDVPTAIRSGESVWLNCTLDLESDDLYSVKWYKGDVEFYRFLPRDRPSGQKYDLPGVFVELEKSRQGCVYLHTSNLNTEGLYRCEASAESPTFQTVEGEKMIQVYVLPEEDPTIQGNLPRYEVGDFVNVTCKSGPSRPAATLKWFINGKAASPDLITGSSVIDHLNGLKTSSVGLSFVVNPMHLHQGGGAIKLKCTAIVSQTYSMTSEELVVGDRQAETSSPSDPRIPPINQFSARNGPTISGGQLHYRVGDILDVNCSSSKSRSAPELQWFLNDAEVHQDQLVKYGNSRFSSGLETSTLGLRFPVEAKHFDENDEMRLKCTATLSEVINMRSEERTVGGNHRSSGLHVSENSGTVLDRDNSSVEKLHQHLFCFVILVASILVNAR